MLAALALKVTAISSPGNVGRLVGLHLGNVGEMIVVTITIAMGAVEEAAQLPLGLHVAVTTMVVTIRDMAVGMADHPEEVLLPGSSTTMALHPLHLVASMVAMARTLAHTMQVVATEDNKTWEHHLVWAAVLVGWVLLQVLVPFCRATAPMALLAVLRRHLLRTTCLLLLRVTSLHHRHLPDSKNVNSPQDTLLDATIVLHTQSFHDRAQISMVMQVWKPGVGSVWYLWNPAEREGPERDCPFITSPS